MGRSNSRRVSSVETERSSDRERRQRPHKKGRRAADFTELPLSEDDVLAMQDRGNSRPTYAVAACMAITSGIAVGALTISLLRINRLTAGHETTQHFDGSSSKQDQLYSSPAPPVPITAAFEALPLSQSPTHPAIAATLPPPPPPQQSPSQPPPLQLPQPPPPPAPSPPSPSPSPPPPSPSPLVPSPSRPPPLQPVLVDEQLTGRACRTLMRTRGNKLWTMWSSVAWGTRQPGMAGCWTDRGSSSFFSHAYEGDTCSRNWFEGTVNNAQFQAAEVPALMGNDPAILEYCLRLVNRWRRVWFAKNEEVAFTCLEAQQNVLRLGRSLWDICTNFEFVGCAARGKLPRQTRARINFATPPGQLWIRDLKPETTIGYVMEDVLYLETCVLNELCENGEEMFHLQSGEGFECETSRERFEAFGQLMMSMD